MPAMGHITSFQASEVCEKSISIYILEKKYYDVVKVLSSKVGSASH